MIGNSQVPWDRAIDEVANRMLGCIEEFGPDSVATYVSGQLLTEDYYVANKLMKGFIGSGNIDTNSRLCMASAVSAHLRAFGEDIVPCTYDDLDDADLILLVGSNTAWCHPVIWQRIEKARECRGAKLVVIDPRRTETAECADLHIAIDPDGDIRLFNALLAEMARRGQVDRAYLDQECDVAPGFWEGLGCDPGISPQVFRRLAGLVETNPRMITLFSQGANQSVCGTDKGNAIINLHLAMGRINRPGAGPFSITGQPNAMGGREVGGLASILACHLGFSSKERRDVAEFWNAPNICHRPGLKAVDLFEAIHRGDVKFLWVMATNPAVSMPDASFVREALVRCPTVVVSDVMADTDTGRLADIRLPALAWGEKDGTVTNSERMISRQRSLLPTPGEALPDWKIICDVAQRMGFGKAFGFRSPADIFREYAAMTGLARRHGKLLDLGQWSDCSDAEYQAMEPFRWGGQHPLSTGFPTANGKAHLVGVSPPVPSVIDSAYPLRLNTGRYRDQWHTMTRTGMSATLSHHRREPLVEVHPDDATRFGLAADGLAEVSTEQGSAIYRVAITAAQQRGTVFVPMHWTDVMGGGGRTGRLARSNHDPLSGQPGFKNIPAAIKLIRPDWRAFLVSREHRNPQALYWVRSRIAGGWLTEIAGMDSIECDALLPAGQRSEVADFARGLRRIVVTDETGELLAALFVTRTGQLPAREWIADQLAHDDVQITELLAGRPAIPQPDRGPIVCVCHGVGEQQILEACAQGADNLQNVGQCTGAGTNCGSCRPAISRLIEEAQAGLKEAAQ